MPPPKQQVFSQLVVKSTDIQDPEIREKIQFLMMAYEQANMERVNSDIALLRATGLRLHAQAAEMEAKAALHEIYALGDTRCALESNWDYFRDASGTPCTENYLSERDQRNMMRYQKARMQKEVETQSTTGNFGDMFESGEAGS